MNTDQNACPVTGKVIQDISNAPTTNYKGKTYYFCCAGCLKRFESQPETYLSGSHSGGCCHSHC